MKTILVVDDEPKILDVVEYALQKEGYNVITVQNGQEALEMYNSEKIDFIVLDINLPDFTGFDICKEIRTKSKVPILMLTSRDAEIDRVVGLEIGADDYVPKPFSPRELIARIKAIMRRSSEFENNAGKHTVGPFTIDREKFQIILNGKLLELSKTEFNLFEVLMKRPGKVFERAELFKKAWSSDYVATDRTIDAHIKSIRKKIKQIAPNLDPVETIRGVGYKIKENIG